MEPETQATLFSKIIPLGLTGIVSLIIGICLEKFKNRTSFLKYSISFQPLATSSQTEPWGEIEVRHNGRITKHLNFVTIEIENDSNIDHQNLVIEIWCDKQSQFLAHNGFYNENNRVVLLENNYYNSFVDVSTQFQLDVEAKDLNSNHITPPQLLKDIDWIQTNKRFHLPAFNRSEKITINLLAENYEAFMPTINVSILHKSVKLIKASVKDDDVSKTFIWAFVIGLIIFVIGVAVLYNYYSHSAVLLTATLGLVYSVIGFGLYKVFKFLKRLFS